MSLRTWWRLAPLLTASLLVVGCAAAKPPLILVPTPTERAATHYQRGQPFASLGNDSVSVLISADNCTLFDTPYLRVWLLYSSRLDHPVLLDPINSVMARATLVEAVRGRAAPRQRSSRLDVRDGDVPSPGPAGEVYTTHVGSPTLPYQLLAEAQNAKVAATIATVIGGALRSASAAANTRPTTFSLGSQVGMLNDRQDKVTARTDAIAQDTRAQVADIAAAHQMFEASFNSGVLRKHTVFPHSGVNGYLYIPLRPYTMSFQNLWPPESVTYYLTFRLPGLSDSLTFRPGYGE